VRSALGSNGKRESLARLVDRRAPRGYAKQNDSLKLVTDDGTGRRRHR